MSFIDLPGAVTAWDIAYDLGDIWVACAAPGTPILRYNSSSTIVDQIESSLVPSATGLTMDDDGFLWASDNTNGKIYKIDPDGTGTGEGDTQGIADAAVILSPNPFLGSLTITGTGFGSVVNITICDMSGRIVRTAQTDGCFTWTGTDGSGALLPNGVYTITVTGWTRVSSRAVLLR